MLLVDEDLSYARVSGHSFRTFASTGPSGKIGASTGASSKSEQKEGSRSAQLSFVLEFSSAEDVKGESHPILNKSVDIIAGPKEQSPTTDVLEEPANVTTDSSHRIYVTDLGTGTVHLFDFARSKYSLLHGGDHLRSPLGIAADREGHVYVSDNGPKAILVYDSTGKFIDYFKKPRGRESYFDGPQGIAVDAATGRVFVCDIPRHMVVVLGKKGEVIARFGKRGGGKEPGEFR